MSSNPNTAQLAEQGVSIWLDDLSRGLINNGGLQNYIDTRSVVGVTTNPTIFAEALADGDAYETQLEELAAADATREDAVVAATVRDVQSACDVFEPIASATNGVDGRVSLEVDPRLAKDTQGTLSSARELWSAIDRSNAMIKIPATVEGLPAVTSAIADGICVNVTLIFSLDRYSAVMDAYLDGLEQAAKAGHDLGSIHSVASFFISRVDAEIDNQLDEIGSDDAKALKGKAGIANAVLAYQRFQDVCASDRWKALEDQGARMQRPLWASTSTKDPSYPDTLYVTELVAPNTVNTMPAKTLEALAERGGVSGDTVTNASATATKTMEQLENVGVSYDDVVATLEEEGVEKFVASWNELLETVEDQLARHANSDSAAEAAQ